jgi:mRNA interferase HigB
MSCPQYKAVTTDKIARLPVWDYTLSMRLIALSTLKAYWENRPEYLDARDPVLSWYRHTLRAEWSSPMEVKSDFRNASILRDGRVVFNIAGNKYRLVVWINYPYRVVYVRFIGTHAQYDAIDAQTI